MRGIRGSVSDHYVVLCKVRLVSEWMKRRGVVNEAWRIRSDKLSEHYYVEGYGKYLESKRLQWNEDGNVNQMWEQVK